jgi:hypothetical protein
LLLLGNLSPLQDPDVIAEGVSKAHINAIEVLGGLLGEIVEAGLRSVLYNARA